jgi:hypothetical protein
MSAKIEELKAKLAAPEFAEDVVKFYEKGNGLAGARIRKVMQEVKALAQDVRFEVSEIKAKKVGDESKTEGGE